MGKVVQTVLGEADYQLLRRLSEASGKSLKALVAEAVAAYVKTEGKIRADDPLFSPPVSKTGARDASERHDEYLYGGRA